MKKIIKEHPEMSIDVLKQLPYLLNDPILVMDSKTVSGRLILLGDVYANGKVVSMILEINPSTRSGKTTYVNVIKVASAHTRSNIQNLINSSNIRYVMENKNRVNEWLKVNRLQLPLPNSHSDSATDIIAENAKNVKGIDKNSSGKSSGKQHALPLDEDGNIPASEVALSKKSKKTVDNSKTKAEAKAEKTLERGRKALEAEKSKLRADYRTDRVYNEQSIKKELNDSVEDFKHLHKDRTYLASKLDIDLSPQCKQKNTQ